MIIIIAISSFLLSSARRLQLLDGSWMHPWNLKCILRTVRNSPLIVCKSCLDSHKLLPNNSTPCRLSSAIRLRNWNSVAMWGDRRAGGGGREEHRHRRWCCCTQSVCQPCFLFISTSLEAISTFLPSVGRPSDQDWHIFRIAKVFHHFQVRLASPLSQIVDQAPKPSCFSLECS